MGTNLVEEQTPSIFRIIWRKEGTVDRKKAEPHLPEYSSHPEDFNFLFTSVKNSKVLFPFNASLSSTPFFLAVIFPFISLFPSQLLSFPLCGNKPDTLENFSVSLLTRKCPHRRTVFTRDYTLSWYKGGQKCVYQTCSLRYNLEYNTNTTHAIDTT